MMEESMYLRVHSSDLHEHIAQEVGECLETGLYTDLMIRCKKGASLHAHKLVLGAISPYLKMLLSSDHHSSDIQSLEFPDIDFSQIQRLLEVVYNGSVEATMEEMKSLILLAHSLYISIPLSDELIQMLDLQLPALRPLPPQVSVSVSNSNGANKPIVNFLNMKLPPNTQISPKVFRGGTVKLPQTPHDFGYSSNDDGIEFKRQKLDNGVHEFLCPICNSTYSNMGNFKQHMRRHENENQHNRDDRMSQINEMITTCFDPLTSQYTCQVCKSTYSHPGNFKQHLLKHEREAAAGIRYKAKTVNTITSTGSSGSNNNTHLSDVLHSAFADRVDHGDRNLDANVKMYECHHCGRAFKHPGNFKQHLSSHMRLTTSMGPNVVVVPKQMFNNKPKVIVNNPPELPQVPVLPSTLPKGVLPNKPHFLMGNVIAPMMSEHQTPIADPPPSPTVTRWKCNHCITPMFYQSREKLRQHIQANHRGPKPAIATQATQPIPVELAPTEPVPISIAASYHECDVCHQIFESQSIKNKHMLTHQIPNKDESEEPQSASEPMFPCDVGDCHQTFSKEVWLIKHKESSHGVSFESTLSPSSTSTSEFECRICKKTFPRSSKLAAHMKIHR